MFSPDSQYLAVTSAQSVIFLEIKSKTLISKFDQTHFYGSNIYIYVYIYIYINIYIYIL